MLELAGKILNAAIRCMFKDLKEKCFSVQIGIWVKNVNYKKIEILELNCTIAEIKNLLKNLVSGDVRVNEQINSI